jgi:K+-sensing histidine kinase KdpD
MLPDFRVRQRDYLLEISRALSQELDLDKLLERILKISIEILAGHAGVIALRSETGEWHVRVSHGLPPALLRVIEKSLSELSLGPEDTEEFELVEINRILQRLTRTASLGLNTGVGLPLTTQQKTVGVTFIFRNYPDLFSANDRRILSSFAAQAAIAVQNAQLYRQINFEKQRITALLDSAADGIMILTPDHRIESCNPAFLRILNKKNDDVLNNIHENVIQWAVKPQGLSLEQAEAGGWPLTPHAQLYIEGDLVRNVDLPPLPVGITYAPLISEDGTLINIIATVRDITRFRQADELKSTFISIISHELKTPVALIKGYASTLRREDAKWNRKIVDDSLEIIEEEADRLTGLIENLLDATRLQAGGVALKKSDVNLAQLSKRLAERFQTQTDQHTIVVDFPEHFPVVMVDENRIIQVLNNLISNAIKYSPRGTIRISGQIKPEAIVVCVSDQGPGIAPEDMPHVFDKFYRAPDLARQTKGAGLGLFLTRSIIEAHDGRIWIDPESGKGARICFSLPTK